MAHGYDPRVYIEAAENCGFATDSISLDAVPYTGDSIGPGYFVERQDRINRILTLYRAAAIDLHTEAAEKIPVCGHITRTI